MNKMKRKSLSLRLILILTLSTVAVIQALPSVWAGTTLSTVRSAGVVRCGVSEETAGFSYRDKAGRWQGFSVDFCRAVAAAALNDGEKVSFRPLSPAGRFPVLLSGSIDLLAHTATVTFGREVGIGVEFAGVYFYDGQTFMAPRKSKVKKIENLKGATICVQRGTTHLKNLENVFGGRGLAYKTLVFDSLPEVTGAFFQGKCRAFTGDRSNLAAVRLSAPGGPGQYDILSGAVSKEPLGPTVRRGDEEWLTLVRWVLYALVEAEERGVTQGNVRELQKTAKDPGLRWFLNSSGELGKSIGLKPDWVAGVISRTGNYGEMYERHLGGKSALKMERGLNRLWSRGGLLYAPPFQ